MSLDTSTVSEPTLDSLKTLIAPQNIAYYSEGGSTGPRAREACQTIRTVDDPGVLRALLEHSKTLRTPQGKEFPIARVRSAIVGRLEELGV